MIPPASAEIRVGVVTTDRTETASWRSPSIVIRPGRCGGQPTVGEHRIPAEFVAGAMWEHGMGEAETQWEPIIDRYGVLVACWYMARYGTRKWQKRWGGWLETADVELWHSEISRWDNCPDPPTRKAVNA